MTIIERICNAMKEQKISRAKLAKLSGLKKTTVYRIFDKKIDGGKIRIETLVSIAKTLNVSLDYLATGKSEEVNVTMVNRDEWEKIKPSATETMKIIVYSNGIVELFVNGKKRRVTSIKFIADNETVPTLTTTEIPIWEE